LTRLLQSTAPRCRRNLTEVYELLDLMTGAWLIEDFDSLATIIKRLSTCYRVGAAMYTSEIMKTEEKIRMWKIEQKSLLLESIET
jgi:hypothetical protein